MSALFLDVKGVFLSVVVDQLIHNIQMKGVPMQYTEWVQRRLQVQCTRIQFDDLLSDLLDIDNRCNQGDPISVVLYHFYNAGLKLMAKQSKGKMAPAFINDMTFLVAGNTFRQTLPG